MGKLLKYLAAVVLLFVGLGAIAQDKTVAYYNTHESEILPDAQAAFRNGDYDRAVELCRLHYAIVGDTRADGLREKAEQCARLAIEMNTLASVGQQTLAQEKAKVILSLNPDDKHAQELNIKSKVGDVYRDESGNPVYVDGVLMRIGYIDETGEHGFSFFVVPKKYNYPYTVESEVVSLRPPYLSELKLLYGNNHILGLSGEFWSLDDLGSVSGSLDEWYGSLAFDTGRESRRRSSRILRIDEDGHLHHVFRGAAIWTEKRDRNGRIVSTTSTSLPRNAETLYCINIHPF